MGLRGTPGGSDMEGGGSPPTSPVKLPFESVTNIALDWDDTLLPTTQLTDNFGDYITIVGAGPAQRNCCTCGKTATKPQGYKRANHHGVP